ncbi:PRC-barrel domain-containing protein [Candidatus Nitrospira bockiana]
MTNVRLMGAVLSLTVAGFVGTALAAVESEQGALVPPDAGMTSTPGEYTIPPVNPKSLKNADDHPWNNKEVKNPQGETLGTIDHVMVDTKSGQEHYAMLKLSDSMYPMPIPLGYFKESETGLILQATKDQLKQGAPNLGGKSKSQDFEHMGGEPLKPNLRQGGG